MTAPRVVFPNPRIPSMIGTLNIVFGLLLLLSSLAVIVWTLASPQLVALVESPTARSAREAGKAERARRMAELTKQRTAATDPGDQLRVQREIDDLTDEQTAEEFAAGNFNGRDERDPRQAVPFWTDHVLSVVLNGLMALSGAGLVALRPWGRRLAVRVAAVKAVKLVLFTMIAVFLTIPDQAARTREFWARMDLRTGRSAAFGTSMAVPMAQMAAVSAGATAVGFGAAGLVYPLVSLWLLNRPSVRAACEGRKAAAVAAHAGTAPADVS